MRSIASQVVGEIKKINKKIKKDDNDMNISKILEQEEYIYNNCEDWTNINSNVLQTCLERDDINDDMDAFYFYDDSVLLYSPTYNDFSNIKAVTIVAEKYRNMIIDIIDGYNYNNAVL